MGSNETVTFNKIRDGYKIINNLLKTGSTHADHAIIKWKLVRVMFFKNGQVIKKIFEQTNSLGIQHMVLLVLRISTNRLTFEKPRFL